MTTTTSARMTVADAMAAARMHTDATGRGVTVALIDTGVAPSPMLANANIIVGPDFSGEDAEAGLDTNGHGTHLAGVIVASAPEARLLSLKAGASDGQTHPKHVAAAIDWLVDSAPADGLMADVLVLAYCIDADAPEARLVEKAVDRAWDAGITVVVAAGNTGEAPIQAPANSRKVIAVGGAEMTDGVIGLADFSTQGDSVRGLDVIAPGRSIISARAIGSSSDAENEAGRVGEHLVAATGSSQSAALTGAAVALLLEGRSLTNDQIKSLLIQTTQEATGTSAGALDLAAAVCVAGPSRQIARPSITELDLSLAAAGFSTAWAGRSWSATSWGGTRWSATSWGATSWGGTRWSATSWGATSWGGTRWSATSWGATSWGGTRWSATSWGATSWGGTRWSATSWGATSWGGTRWSATSWGATSWGGTRWTATSWGATSWGATSWGGTRWTATSWGATSWGGTRWV